MTLTNIKQRREQIESRIADLEDVISDAEFERDRLERQLARLKQEEAGEGEELKRARLLLEHGKITGPTMELLERVVSNGGPLDSNDEKGLKDVLWWYREEIEALKGVSSHA